MVRGIPPECDGALGSHVWDSTELSTGVFDEGNVWCKSEASAEVGALKSHKSCGVMKGALGWMKSYTTATGGLNVHVWSMGRKERRRVTQVAGWRRSWPTVVGNWYNWCRQQHRGSGRSWRLWWDGGDGVAGKGAGCNGDEVNTTSVTLIGSGASHHIVNTEKGISEHDMA